MLLVTGASGMLGSLVVEELKKSYPLLSRSILTPSREELNLFDQASCFKFFQRYKPETVIHLAAKVMGLQGNLERQAESFEENSLINSNILQASIKYNPTKIFFAGSAASYGYPYQSLPLEERHFLNGDVHEGEYGYAWSKRVSLPALKILRDEYGVNVVYGILTNLFGPNDRFFGKHTHVIPALIFRAFNSSRERANYLDVWGSPTTTRDFLYAPEAARVVVELSLNSSVLLNNFFVNIASNVQTTMQSVATIISREFELSKVNWLHDKPVGVQNRLLDTTKLINLGITPIVDIPNQLIDTISWFKSNSESLR